MVADCDWGRKRETNGRASERGAAGSWHGQVKFDLIKTQRETTGHGAPAISRGVAWKNRPPLSIREWMDLGESLQGYGVRRATLCKRWEIGSSDGEGNLPHSAVGDRVHQLKRNRRFMQNFCEGGRACLAA